MVLEDPGQPVGDFGRSFQVDTATGRPYSDSQTAIHIGSTSTSVGSHTYGRTIIKYSCQIATMTTRLAVARTKSEGVKLLAVASTRRRLRPLSNVEAKRAAG